MIELSIEAFNAILAIIALLTITVIVLSYRIAGHLSPEMAQLVVGALRSVADRTEKTRWDNDLVDVLEDVLTDGSDEPIPQPLPDDFTQTPEPIGRDEILTLVENHKKALDGD